MEDKYSVKQLFLFIIIILVILGIFYGITTIVTNKKKTTKESVKVSDEDIKIDYDTILVQNIFSQKNNYYVLATVDDDENIASYNNSISDYEEKEDALKVYNIDLSSAFNKTYVADESNFSGDYPIFKETTLLKIEDKKITEVYEGEDDIKTVLTTLTAE